METKRVRIRDSIVCRGSPVRRVVGENEHEAGLRVSSGHELLDAGDVLDAVVAADVLGRLPQQGELFPIDFALPFVGEVLQLDREGSAVGRVSDK